MKAVEERGCRSGRIQVLLDMKLIQFGVLLKKEDAKVMEGINKKIAWKSRSAARPRGSQGEVISDGG